MTPSVLVRSWPPLAAWGAGLLEIGLGAGAVTKGVDVASRGIGTLLVVVGAVTFGWGVAALATSRVAAPRTGMTVSLVGIGGVVAALVVDPGRIGVQAVGVCVLLSLIVGVAAATAVRRGRPRPATADGTRASGPRSAGAQRTSILGLVAGCVVVAGLVTPALGSTAVGSDAPDHSGHRVVLPGHGH